MVQLLLLVLYQLGQGLLSPIFWLVALVIFWQTKRTAKAKQEFFHTAREKVFGKTLILLGIGILGGVVGSLLLVLLGVSLDGIGLSWLWLAALLLVLIRQRFLCFAYSGGILALCSYFFGWPEINIAQLLALVAVLHMVEALLMVLSSKYGAMPIYTRKNDGQIVGGYLLQIFWPLPLVAMLPVLSTPAELSQGVLAMPDWWPLLQGQLNGEDNIVYSLLPILAALGYSDLVLTDTVRHKVCVSASHLFLYSGILLGLAVLGDRHPELLLLPAVFAPLGHEWLIRWERRKEENGECRYISPPGKTLVLDVLPHSQGAALGIAPGDCLEEEPETDWIRMGVIIAPRGKYGAYLRLGTDKGAAAVLLKKFANRWQKRLKKG